ncbi:hypothetical protein EIP91_005871 [Steccherinum ochraceum]|uniref:Uncharacterized protein n=1 Tax=Steccherinum ochraceum TaxID=92696 RepID=A0A4R0RLI9_9APHY|nr:hypothetical protein EIP91_005871 [Steccherinum ochraceum]
MTADQKAQQLRTAIRLLTEASEVVIKDWENEERSPTTKQSDGSSVPSHALHDARRTMQGAMGLCNELVLEPRARLMEMALEFYEARALHVAVEAQVADILDAEGDKERGMTAAEISRKTGIKEHKIARILRTLASSHVFREVSYGYFANNSVSQVLVGNEPLRSFILTMAWSVYTASVKLPDVLLDAKKTQSDSALDTAFQLGQNSKLHFFEWLEEPVKHSDGTTGAKRDLSVFGLAMLGGGRALGVPLHHDYPWQDLGSATVVDVGGGVGGLPLELCKVHRNLKFVIQDRPAVIKQAETVWNQQHPDALKTGRTKLVTHDFFTEQPIKNAEVYHMRYIMHDWPDEDCIRILQAIRPAMGPNSRILISDAVMLPTCSSDSAAFTTAPAPLPANYGAAHRYQHLRDLNMLTLLNGRERGPEEFRMLAEKAGLKLEKIWECRGFVWITEMRRKD